MSTCRTPKLLTGAELKNFSQMCAPEHPSRSSEKCAVVLSQCFGVRLPSSTGASLHPASLSPSFQVSCGRMRVQWHKVIAASFQGSE